MRIFFANINRPKTIAKKLKSELEKHGIALPLSRCQAETAHLFDYRD